MTSRTKPTSSHAAPLRSRVAWLPILQRPISRVSSRDRSGRRPSWFRSVTSRSETALPNAGLPRNVGGVATYDLTPEELATSQERFVKEYGVTAVGGCCGTTPEHIKALAERVGSLTPAARPSSQPPHISSLY